MAMEYDSGKEPDFGMKYKSINGNPFWIIHVLLPMHDLFTLIVGARLESVSRKNSF